MEDGGNRERNRTLANARERAARLVGGRPLTVYVVLVAGVLALIFLLAIVWLSATNGDGGDPPICSPINLPDALANVEAGQIERVDMVAVRDRPDFGPMIIQIELLDGTCRQLEPPGVTGREQAYRFEGAVDWHNRTAEQRIRVHTRFDDLPTDLLVPPTPSPTLVPTATVPPPASPTAPPPPPTVEATATIAPTDTPTPPPTPTAPPAVVASPPDAAVPLLGTPPA
jgi:hypothetical protein